MLKEVLDCLLCMCSVSIVVFTIYRLLIPRKLTIGVACLMPILVASCYYFFTYSTIIQTRIGNPSIQQRLVFFSMMFFYFLLIMLCFKDKWKEKLKVFLGSFLSIFLAESALAMPLLLFNVITQNPKDLGLPWRLTIDLLALMSYALAFRFFYTIHKKGYATLPVPIYFATMIILVSGSLLIFLALDAAFVDKEYYRITSLAAFVCMIFLVVALILVLYYTAKQEQFKKETYAAQKLQESEIFHVQEIYEKSETMRKVQHDLKDTLSVVQILLQNPTEESLAKVSSILEDLNQKIASSHIQIYTHNVLLNTVLSSKISEAKENGITVDADIQIPKGAKGVRDIDIGLILVNLFNNAMEACKKLDPKTQKAIRFRLSLKGNFLFFKLSNPYVQIKTDKNGMFKTTKQNEKEHGIGLAILESIVKKYRGEQHISTENQIFTHTITLELDEKLM